MANDNPKLIISLEDIRQMKSRKEDELEYYTKQLEELQVKMVAIQKEIQLTETILKMVETETVKDLVKPVEDRLLITPKDNTD